MGLPDAGRLRALIERYDQPGPRYTSYPTVPVWSDSFGPADFERALGESGGQPISLYVHVPYCERLCSFCACNRTISRDHGVVPPYLDRIEREADLIAAALASRRSCAQLAIGGGSPNFLSPDQLDRLLRIVDERFAPEGDAERSIELDPRNTTREQLAVLAERGVGRMSFGVQDLDAKVQEAIHRIQPREQVDALVEDARGLGITSVNLDLIYGLPYQTEESFARTLDHVAEMRPDRIALYSYAHVTWISKAQRGFEKKDLPPAERKLAIFILALERLRAEGYRFLGMDHFALPEDELTLAADRGHLTRNFMGYSVRAGEDLLALGPSGISELSSAYAQSARTPEEWAEPVDAGRLPTLRGHRLSEDDQRRRWVIRAVMCEGRLCEESFVDAFGCGLREMFPSLDSDFAPFVADGLVTRRGSEYRVTELGRLFLRPIAMTFDAYLQPASGEQPRFSRTV